MNKYIYLPVRLSHLLRHCSVGAIVRGNDYLLTVKDIRDWTTKDGEPAGHLIPYVDQVRAALGIPQELREPPIAKELDSGQVDGVCIPAVRFPSWMKCPKCGLLYLKPWIDLPENKKPECTHQCQGRPELEQVPWVLIHEAGHMADVPWHFLTHKEAKTPSQIQCRPDWAEPYLKILEFAPGRRRLHCIRCGATNNFGDSEVLPYGKARQQPWVKESPSELEYPARVLEINDARVHSSITKSALVIPPESRIRKGTVVDRLYSSTQKRLQIERAKAPLAKKTILKITATELQCTVDEINSALSEIKNGYPLYGKNVTYGLLLEEEYQAFINEIPNVSDDEDFVTKHYTEKWKSNGLNYQKESRPRQLVGMVNNLIGVSRLKEIMVLTGFQRLGGEIVPPDIVGISNWLPALELYGEGIFFSFNEQSLREWESINTIKSRAQDFKKRFTHSGIVFESELQVTPRFLFLHTLSHLLIRQLETVAGYSAASLKERIYCSGGGLEMAGILIYVAVPDVAGSLGGLAELAAPDRFMSIFSSVFDHAEWCSLDPVCSEHEGQGPNLLNRAACHACALVPEPSCSYGNVLLDRVFIRGDRSAGIPSFLDNRS